ncbi:hypothetical protein ABZ887_50635, partial [Streptomyces sp. NPDC047061]
HRRRPTALRTRHRPPHRPAPGNVINNFAGALPLLRDNTAFPRVTDLTIRYEHRTPAPRRILAAVGVVPAGLPGARLSSVRRASVSRTRTVHALHDKGVGISIIVKELKPDHRTVQKYVRAARVDDIPSNLRFQDRLVADLEANASWAEMPQAALAPA